MADSAAFPAEFRSLEENFVESKMAINNAVNEILHSDGTSSAAPQLAQASVVEAQRCVRGTYDVCCVEWKATRLTWAITVCGMHEQMKMMSIEVRGKPPMLRKAMQAKINLYRDELQGLQRDLERAQLMARETKANPRASYNQNSQYERITDNTNRLLRQRLESSQRIVAETEEIGISVLDTLAQQRESLLSAHEKVRETREVTGDARRILQRMTRRILTNRIVLYTVIALLLIAICFVIYHDFIKARDTVSDFFFQS
ncbi:Vesicle transport v-snare 13, partial [Globisporangium splendens]